MNNCFGVSDSNIGISASSITNSRGISTSGNGIVAPRAHNCYGETTSGTNGINGAVISFCQAKRDGGVAIVAANAIGCNVIGTGTVSATNKFLGTP